MSWARLARLQHWKAEIEAADGSQVVIAPIPVVNGSYVLAPDLPGRATLARFFSDDRFRAQFVRTHAISINSPGFHFVLVNQDRLPIYPGTTEDLISHELGHAWLDARGLKAPPAASGVLYCEPVHTGDIVQHIVIRAEQDRRGFLFRPGWIRSLEKALNPAIEPARDPCIRLERLSLYVDVALGLTDDQWPARSEFLRQLLTRDARLAEAAIRLTEFLPHLRPASRLDYYAALGAVRSIALLMLE